MRDEERIARQVERELEEDPTVRTSRGPLWVRESDGVLRLEGEVEDIASKRRAFARATAVPGVWHLVDRVRVRPATAMGDGTIRDHLRDALLTEQAFDDSAITVSSDGHTEIVRDGSPEPGGAIRIQVHDGRVELHGRVRALAHRRLAETLAWWVPGTCEVQNELVVRPLEDDNDDEINDAVRTALEKDPLIDAAQLRVETRRAAVTLHGTVASDELRRIAERDAWIVSGVRDVIDRIDVA